MVAVLKQAEEEGKPVESVRLVDRQLRQLPEAFGRIQGLRVLDVSRNQLEVTNYASSCLTRSTRLGRLCHCLLPTSHELLRRIFIVYECALSLLFLGPGWAHIATSQIFYSLCSLGCG